MMRESTVNRKTKETDISVRLVLDGKGESKIDTGIGFFDHMLQGFAKHGFFDLEVKATGDLNVDGHHTVEDTGIVLGEAFAKAVGDKAGMKRYGTRRSSSLLMKTGLRKQNFILWRFLRR